MSNENTHAEIRNRREFHQTADTFPSSPTFPLSPPEQTFCFLQAAIKTVAESCLFLTDRLVQFVQSSFLLLVEQYSTAGNNNSNHRKAVFACKSSSWGCPV